MSGVGSAQSAQTMVMAGVIADPTVGVTRASIGTAVTSRVTDLMIDLLIMARSVAVRLMVDATVTTRVAMVKGVTLGELTVRATGIPGVKICQNHAQTLCYLRLKNGALVPVIW